MNVIYGYCRISTRKQSIERQERNILAAYPSARITKEIYTGTKLNRKGLDKILREVRSGDTIVFDSVSRMSRDATEGIELYMQLMDKGIELVFLKEPYVNTETYKQALSNGVELVGNEIADIYIEATNKVLRLLGKSLGTPQGSVLNVKKKAPAMAFIARHYIEFGGSLNATQCAAAAKISRKTFYKYRDELRQLAESEQ